MGATSPDVTVQQTRADLAREIDDLGAQIDAFKFEREELQQYIAEEKLVIPLSIQYATANKMSSCYRLQPRIGISNYISLGISTEHYAEIQSWQHLSNVRGF
jgi:hypothetical protein